MIHGLLILWGTLAILCTVFGLIYFALGLTTDDLDEDREVKTSAGLVLGGIFLPFIIIGLFVYLMYKAFKLYFPKERAKTKFPVR